MKKLLSLLILLLSHSAHSSLPEYTLNDRLDYFALGSCNRQSDKQWAWPIAEQRNPDLWLWLGDNIYGDSDDKAVMKEKYDQLSNNPGYKSFRKNVPVIGIWDDHDYGLNDGGKDFHAKEQNRLLFLDFIGEEKSSKRWKQKGIYTTYKVGPEGQQVRFILLDTRYHLEKYGDEADILGETQWEWLEEILKTSEAQIHFIASGISVLTAKKKAKETWQKSPKAFRRLHSLLQKYNTPGVFFLVGDRHLSTAYQKERHGILYTEIMASGMTHNKSGIGKSIARSYYGKKNSLFHNNFGEIRIHWEKPIQIEFGAYSRKAQELRINRKFRL